jgi:alkylation response protein AidB-like acyl-CoA dehydrogenase
MADRPAAQPARRALDGHVPPDAPLSPRAAFAGLSRLVKPLVQYAIEDPWELDTRTLPRALGAHRRRLRAFADDHLRPAALAVDLEPHLPPGEQSPRTRAVLEAAGRAGLLSDMLPRPLGGADPRLFALPLQMAAALKTEELAAVDGGLMLLVCAHSLGVAPLLIAGDLGAIRRYLLPAAKASLAGEPHLFAFAITEPAAGSDVEEGHGAAHLAPTVVARKDDRGWKLRGRKCYISGGDLARDVVVFAALEGEGMASWTAFLVDARAFGYQVARTELKMGMRASGAAELELDDVHVPDERVLGGLRKGWGINRAVLNMSRLPVAAMGVGFARQATDLAIEFACGERLGGKPLIHYQDVQLAIADMLLETQAARAMVWAAAQRPQAIQREASAAKVFCTDTALRVCTRAMDLLGNHGLLHGARVEKAWRDARLTQIFEGTNQINRLAMVEDAQEQLLSTIARLEAEHAR